MSIQKILAVTDPALRTKSKSVATYDRRIEKVIADLTTTLLAQKNPVGVGLAAAQTGKNVRVFIIKSGKKIIPFINPEIVWKSKETNDPSALFRQGFDGELSRTAQDRSGQAPAENQSPITPPKARLARLASKRAKGGNHQSHEYIMEGCLSLPHYYGPVKRARKIKVKYQIPTPITNHPSLITKIKTFSGLPAQIIQHEVDHLNGVLFVDRLITQKRKLYRWTGKDWEEVELP